MIVPHFTRALALPPMLLWATLRAWVAVGSIAMTATLGFEALPHPLFMTPRAALLLVALVATAGWVNARRRHLVLYLGNLGVGRVRVATWLLGPVLLLELAVGVAVRL